MKKRDRDEFENEGEGDNEKVNSKDKHEADASIPLELPGISSKKLRTLTSDDLRDIARLYKELHDAENERQTQLISKANSYNSKFLDAKKWVYGVFNWSIDYEYDTMQRILSILGDVVCDEYMESKLDLQSCKSPGSVVVYKFKINFPIEIDYPRIVSLKSIRGVLYIEIDQSSNVGEMYLSIHVSIDDDAIQHYLDEDLKWKENKIVTDLKELESDPYAKKIMSNLYTCIELDPVNDIFLPHTTYAPVTNQPIRSFTMPVKAPIRYKQMKAIMQMEALYNLKFKPHNKSNKILMIIDILIPKT